MFHVDKVCYQSEHECASSVDHYEQIVNHTFHICRVSIPSEYGHISSSITSCKLCTTCFMFVSYVFSVCKNMTVQCTSQCKLFTTYFTLNCPRFPSSVSTNVCLHITPLSKLGTACFTFKRFLSCEHERVSSVYPSL